MCRSSAPPSMMPFAEVPVRGLEHTERGRGFVVQHVQAIPKTGQVDPECWLGRKSMCRIVSLRANGTERKTLNARSYISSTVLDDDAPLTDVPYL